jgi:hypothetical protein
MGEICLWEVLHDGWTGLTGAPDQSDRCPPPQVRTKTRSRDRFRFVKGFPYEVRPSQPIDIRGHDRLREPIDQINLFLFLPFLFDLNFSNLLLVGSPSSLRRLRVF